MKVARDKNNPAFQKKWKERLATTSTIRRNRNSISKEEILQTAMETLRTEGVDSLSMRNIAQKMGCSVASPYAYFQSREEIIQALILLGEKTLTSQLEAARNSSNDVYVQLDKIARAYWDFSRENRELHKLMFNSISGKLYRQTFPSLPTSYRVFLDTIRQGIRSGEIKFNRSNYHAIARTLWSWMYGLIVLDMNDIMRKKKSFDPIQEGIQLFQLLLRRGE